MRTLFDDLPLDCSMDHDWRNSVTTWPGETIERLTVTCTRCGEVRGRC